MQGIWHPNLLCGGYWYVYPTYKNLIPGHANCMQHIPRCWERQSDGTEYKKTLRRPGLRPMGELTALPQTPSWWGGAAAPSHRTPSSTLCPLGLASPTPTPKLVLTPLSKNISLWCIIVQNAFLQNFVSFCRFILKFSNNWPWVILKHCVLLQSTGSDAYSIYFQMSMWQWTSNQFHNSKHLIGTQSANFPASLLEKRYIRIYFDHN